LGAFAAYPQHPGTFDPRLIEHLIRSDAEIREFQQRAAPDSYWRLYFLLTRGAK
jgi:hypothetical protein